MITAGQAGLQITPVGEAIVVVVEADGECNADLAKVGKTHGLLALLLGAAQRGQNQRGENGDDGDDHQQFNQREGTMKSFYPSHFGMSNA